MQNLRLSNYWNLLELKNKISKGMLNLRVERKLKWRQEEKWRSKEGKRLKDKFNLKMNKNK